MSVKQPKKIGLLIGREWSWPSAFIANVNDRGSDVTAEFVKFGQTFLDDLCEYAVIVDRMSHEIPYYRTYLKFAAMQGVYVINDPFMASADDKFFGMAMAHHLGVRTPKSVALPNKRVETANVPESFRNLKYPMDWQGIIDYVGVPAILKDVNTGGRRLSHRVHDVDELIRWYDESDTLTVMLQEMIETDQHYHAFVVANGNEVRVIRYLPEDGTYDAEPATLSAVDRAAIEATASQMTEAYSYDINMVEFVIGNGELFLINPTNPVPDLDINLLTAAHFEWSVQTIAEHTISLAESLPQQFESYKWHQVLN
ncbi:MAG: hypothetical protein R3300_08280 [Candidatus Promineifilaceae bacterium]|nr:hypothetical protein [Candidatus Promineifilaceae bacterium]